MDRPSAEPQATLRVAVVGAPTVDGAVVRAALAERGVPGRSVDLYGATGREVVLSEYAGEARMIQEPDLDEVALHDLIFLCERGEIASRIVQAAAEAVIIDLADGLPPTARARRVGLDVSARVERGPGRFAVAHPLALVLVEVLEPLDRCFGLEEALAVVLRPAADFGEAGIEELRDQTVRLLSFASVPCATFGRQLAFNLLPEAPLPGGCEALEERIVREIGELLGGAERRVAVRLLTAPLFYGHGLQLRLRLGREAAPEAVAAVLRERGLLAEGPATAATPLDVTGEMRTTCGAPRPDGLGGWWLWGVAGEAGSRPARQAVQLAAALFDL
jgi:aspartate-semialdehyde dehydrogenase